MLNQKSPVLPNDKEIERKKWVLCLQISHQGLRNGWRLKPSGHKIENRISKSGHKSGHKSGQA